MAAGSHATERGAGVQPDQGERDGADEQHRHHDEQVVGHLLKRGRTHQWGQRAHHQARHDQHHGADELDPAGAVRLERLLAHELAQVAPRLQHAGADATLQAGAHLAHETDEQRRQDHHDGHLDGDEDGYLAVHSDTTSSTISRAAKA